MRIDKLALQGFRKARDVTLELGPLTVLIGPNASGKSNILDALRLLYVSVVEADFSQAVEERGGILQVAWKGEPAAPVTFEVTFSEDSIGRFVWKVCLSPRGRGFEVAEELKHWAQDSPPQTIIENLARGPKWWWSEGNGGGRPEYLSESLEPTACVLGSAGKTAAFRGRVVYDHVRSWSFCDPNPGVLRIPGIFSGDPTQLDIFTDGIWARAWV